MKSSIALGGGKGAYCRSLHGERGLKIDFLFADRRKCSRSLHGERGLKKCTAAYLPFRSKSLPSRGAWIENSGGRLLIGGFRLSLPSRGAWIEKRLSSNADPPTSSLPSRGAWIEKYLSSAAITAAKSLPSRGAWIEKRTGR